MPVRRAGKLASLQPKLENAQKRALILSGQLVAQRATQKAPIKTGRLKRSITQGIPKLIATLLMKIDVGTNVFYAPFQEFGTRFIDPRPYLRPALKESRKDIRQIFINSIRAAFK